MSTFPVALPGASNTLMWAPLEEVEPQALNQLRSIDALLVSKYSGGIRVMPDVHLGKGATVGSVIALRDALSPAAVGVDIGCGMSAVRTSLTVDDLPGDLSGIRSSIEARIPVGNGPAGSHQDSVSTSAKRAGITSEVASLWSRFKDLTAPIAQERESRAMSQCGTLGGGNHFIEVCLDDDGNVWLMLHSGSRNIGKELADHHIKVAKSLPHNADLPKSSQDLAVFLGNTVEMSRYMLDLTWAQQYARINRALMMQLLIEAMQEHFPNMTTKEPISCHHNYVAQETIEGMQMLVTRKGAISAKRGEPGIIPGSMGTGSYIVTGLGNPESFFSASHGAGRRMSRSEAKRRYTVDDLVEQTRGVESRKDQAVVDEIPAAYKDIDAVIAAQTDLVAVTAHLTQIVCVKG